MKLKKIERLADTLANHYDEYNDSTADAAVTLARAVLAMLPVVRAAEAWDCVTTQWSGCFNANADLQEALVEMRDTLEKVR